MKPEEKISSLEFEVTYLKQTLLAMHEKLFKLQQEVDTFLKEKRGEGKLCSMKVLK